MKKFYTLFLFCNFCIISFSQTTLIPDVNFEQKLIDLGIDTNGLTGDIITLDVQSVTSLDVSNSTISDLTGIEDFAALQNLKCSNNSLTNLNITQNINLIDIRCSNNLLTSLDVTQNNLLTDLRCGINSISSLDISQNIALTSLRVQSNLLSALDIASNTALETLYIYNNSITEINVDRLTNLSSFWCYDNLLSRLDVTINTALTSLQCYNNNLDELDLVQNTLLTDMNATTNTNLTCIQVLNAIAATDNKEIYVTWLKDIGASYATNCNYPQKTYVPDDNFEQALIDLGYDTILDNYVYTANINTVTSLSIGNKNIIDLTGIEDFTALEELTCSINGLTSLDVSQNTALTILYCNFNNLTSLNLSQNTLLETLYCYSNQLTSLNLSQNTTLTTVSCYNNQLTDLNVKNGNNTAIGIFNSNNNPNLTCINVDDVTYSTTNWTNIDAQTSFSAFCNTPQTYVPDNNFEQALIDLGYDTTLDDYVSTANINAISILDVGSKNISDLTGIEAFTALTDLDCRFNQLTSLNITQNTALTVLNCSFNQITSLNVAQNTALTGLICSANSLSSLSVNANTALEYLYFNNNQITNIDVTQNIALNFLKCENNQIASLDISQNIAIESLFCFNNLLTALDLSTNLGLRNLYCSTNQITSLDLSLNTLMGIIDCSDNALTSLNIKNGNNTNFFSFNTLNNTNLSCIEVDDATYATANLTNIDSQTSFSENCGTLSVNDFDLESATFVYPNPTSKILNINSQLTLKKLELYTLIGKKIFETNNDKINMSLLQNGVYLLKIYSENKIITKKIIKKQ